METGGPRSSLVKEFVIAGHGNLPRVKELLEADPSLLNEAYSWTQTDTETAIQAAAQVGSFETARYLIGKGAPLSTCTAAMMGMSDEVWKALETDPDLIKSKGAHGIPLLPHAAMYGDMELVSELWRRGAVEGATMALHNSLRLRRTEVTKWLLANASPDLRRRTSWGERRRR